MNAIELSHVTKHFPGFTLQDLSLTVPSGTICGLAGLLWICKYGNAQSESCEGYEISVIAAVAAGGCSIAGGQGTVPGVVLGALLIGTLNNILPLIQVSTYWQQAIKGAVILLSVIVNAISQERVTKSELKRRVL